MRLNRCAYWVYFTQPNGGDCFENHRALRLAIGSPLLSSHAYFSIECTLGSTPCLAIQKELKHVPLFELLDDDELSVLAAQVDKTQFAPRQRIYKAGDPSERAYIVMAGNVRVTTIDEDQQEVVMDELTHGGIFGFASLLDQTPHQTSAMAMRETVCIELDRNDIATLVTQKPMASIDMLTALGRQLHASQRLVQSRANRNPNQLIEEETTFGQRLADTVARFGGSWTFIIWFAVVLIAYSSLNMALARGERGTRIRSSCLICFCLCWHRSRRRSS